jgi:hypothetical protein
MKPKTLKQARAEGYMKSGHYLNNGTHTPEKVRLDFTKQDGNSFKFASFWVTRNYAERMGYKNCY